MNKFWKYLWRGTSVAALILGAGIMFHACHETGVEGKLDTLSGGILLLYSDLYKRWSKEYEEEKEEEYDEEDEESDER